MQLECGKTEQISKLQQEKHLQIAITGDTDNRGIHEPFFSHLKLKNWWQHLVYGVDESDGALPCLCASANCPSMETTHLIGAKTCLDVCFLGKKPSALINTLKGSLINDTSPRLLHKGVFLLNFSQKSGRLMMLSLAQKAPPLETLWGGEHTQHLTTPGCLQEEQHH